jgi:hypothetical protein
VFDWANSVAATVETTQSEMTMNVLMRDLPLSSIGLHHQVAPDSDQDGTANVHGAER